MEDYQTINCDAAAHANAAAPAGRKINDHPEDHLVPAFDSAARPSNLFVGTFNLIATILGGAVLSLPVTFAKCGVAFTTFAMLVSAYTTYLSLMMLCYCSRRGGGSSYGEVVRSAFGERAEEAVSTLLFLFLAFVIVAFMVLVRDIWTPLVGLVVPEVEGEYVLLFITVLLLPLTLQRSLHALRFNCYVGTASICVLGIALCRGGWERYLESDPVKSVQPSEHGADGNSFTVDFFKVPSPSDVLFCFPIVTLAFLCHFNIIAIQNALAQPSRKRIRHLTQYAIGACFLLQYTFGLGGYLYAGDQTLGNILLNVPMAQEGILLLLGRMGCGITVAFVIPVIALPCREALLEIVDVWFHHSHHAAAAAAPAADAWCWRAVRRCDAATAARDAVPATEDEVTELLPAAAAASPSRVLLRRAPIQRDYVFRHGLCHCGSTAAIMALCYVGTVAVSGVAVVWSFIGSSMAFLIAFTIPAGCFIVIEQRVPPISEGGDRHDSWIRAAWVILVFSVVGAAVCTVNTLVLSIRTS